MNKMQHIEIKTLDIEAFGRYGSFANLLKPLSPLYEKGEPQFYSDLLNIDLGGSTGASISVGLEKHRDKNIIEFAEFHRFTSEGILPLDGDVILYLAPATGKEQPPFSCFEAFYIPRGTFVLLNQGVWHGCQFPVTEEYVRNLIVLPRCTYMNDTYVYSFREDEKISI